MPPNFCAESNLMISYGHQERKRISRCVAHPIREGRLRVLTLMIRGRADKTLASRSNGSPAVPKTYVSRPRRHLLLFLRRATSGPGLPPLAIRGAWPGKGFQGQSQSAQFAAAQKRSERVPCGML